MSASISHSTENEREEPRPAAEVTRPVAGLYVSLREPVGMVQEPAEAGVEVAFEKRRSREGVFFSA